MKALVLQQFANPEQALRLQEQELPALQPHQVRITMKYSPINPADINLLEGKYPIDVSLPLVPGNEGMGVIAETGTQVKHLKVGQRVVPFQRLNNWCESRIVDADKVFPVPDELSDELAAMLLVNPPTAWRMMHDIVQLQPGDWVIQNAANSVVGRYVIHFAHSLGLKTVNIVRRPELIEPLMNEGATIVLTDEDKFCKRVQEQTQQAEIKLGLNAVGGSNAAELAKSLARGGTVVTYGAMSGQPLYIPNGLLIFRDIRFTGYWVSEWYRHASGEQIFDMFHTIIPYMIERNIRIPIAQTYPLEQYRQAIQHAQQGAREGKILFRMNS
ncbi:MAG: MDR family NADPH-dependent oxidoreductase [bacterium]